MTPTNRKADPGDLSEAQAEFLLPLIPATLPGGRPRRADLRLVINAIFYLLCTECPWRWLPDDYPPLATIEPRLRSFARNF